MSEVTLSEFSWVDLFGQTKCTFTYVLVFSKIVAYCLKKDEVTVGRSKEENVIGKLIWKES